MELLNTGRRRKNGFSAPPSDETARTRARAAAARPTCPWSRCFLKLQPQRPLSSPCPRPGESQHTHLYERVVLWGCTLGVLRHSGFRATLGPARDGHGTADNPVVPALVGAGGFAGLRTHDDFLWVEACLFSCCTSGVVGWKTSDRRVCLSSWMDFAFLILYRQQ